MNFLKLDQDIITAVNLFENIGFMINYCYDDPINWPNWYNVDIRPRIQNQLNKLKDHGDFRSNEVYFLHNGTFVIHCNCLTCDSSFSIFLYYEKDEKDFINSPFVYDSCDEKVIKDIIE